ncbi:MAG: 50S ribosomal protein L11 methyltransferase [Candidatus Pacearchaeota archaeon]|nr:50S ribosomal protein L11 methyltransferase [Candidatus Pacearchaeota archaeon]
MDFVSEIVKKVIEKKPYSCIDERFVLKIASKIKSNDDEERIKLIRAKLRKISTSMLPLSFYRKFEKINFSEDTFKMHKSVKERLGIYPWLVSEIKRRGNSVVDLGCGFNLLALKHFGFVPKYYIGYDVDCAVVKFVERFAKENKINAEIFCSDISDIGLGEGDVYLCLKLFDALEDYEYGTTKKILEVIREKTNHIIASFSTKSMGGKKTLKERQWFEIILNELKMGFVKEKKGNEIFYFIDL